MGLYIEPRMDKQQWLDTICKEVHLWFAKDEPELLLDIASKQDEAVLITIDSGYLAIGLGYDLPNLKRLLGHNDKRPKQVHLVAKSILLELHPYLDEAFYPTKEDVDGIKDYQERCQEDFNEGYQNYLFRQSL